MKLRRARASPCGETLDVAIFSSEERAAEHIRKHVLDPAERWETIVSPDVIEAARTRDPQAVERVYEAYADEIASGLRFGAHLPCHLHGVRPSAPAASDPPCYGFLSRRGVRIFSDDRRIRTAYRTALRRGGHSDYAYFARAWFDFLARSSCKTCLSAQLPPNIVEWKSLEEGRA
jgi:hypothetical protein